MLLPLSKSQDFLAIFASDLLQVFLVQVFYLKKSADHYVRDRRELAKQNLRTKKFIIEIAHYIIWTYRNISESQTSMNKSILKMRQIMYFLIY